MQQHYYIGEGSEAEALVAEVMEKQESVRVARHSICVEYDTDGLVLGRHGQVEGLCFKKKQTCPYLKGEFRYADGGYGYYPKLNSKAGKALAIKLADPLLTFDESDYIVRHLKISRMARGFHAASRTGTALYFTVAGIIDGKLLVKIPDSSERSENGCDPMPVPPAWLREVKESEWLAAQGK